MFSLIGFFGDGAFSPSSRVLPFAVRLPVHAKPRRKLRELRDAWPRVGDGARVAMRGAVGHAWQCAGDGVRVAMRGRWGTRGNARAMGYAWQCAGDGVRVAMRGAMRVAMRGAMAIRWLLRRETAFLFRNHRSSILGQRSAFVARRPKVGARCGKSARRALSGGRSQGPSLPGPTWSAHWRFSCSNSVRSPPTGREHCGRATAMLSCVKRAGDRRGCDWMRAHPVGYLEASPLRAGLGGPATSAAPPGAGAELVSAWPRRAADDIGASARGRDAQPVT